MMRLMALGALGVLLLSGCGVNPTLQGQWQGPTSPVSTKFTFAGDKATFSLEAMGASFSYEGTGKYDHATNRLTLEGMKANMPAVPDFLKDQMSKAFPEKGTVAVLWKNSQEVTLTFEGSGAAMLGGAYKRIETTQ
jgi:hypothetical protein